MNKNPPTLASNANAGDFVDDGSPVLLLLPANKPPTTVPIQLSTEVHLIVLNTLPCAPLLAESLNASVTRCGPKTVRAASARLATPNIVNHAPKRVHHSLCPSFVMRPERPIQRITLTVNESRTREGPKVKAYAPKWSGCLPS